MNDEKLPWRVTLAMMLLSASSVANADWLAPDPGTKISLQVNQDGALVIRPIGGAWSHAVCPDVSAAELDYPRPRSPDSPYASKTHTLSVEMLIAAAANGSLVNLLVDADDCDAHGHPIVRNVRIQGP